MAIPRLADDFKEFLKLLNSNGVEYLPIGGYAVGIYGYVRATNDLDVWVRRNLRNALAVERALREFGFADPSLTHELFLVENNVVRTGVPPMRLEILTSISGVNFEQCYAEKFPIDIEGLEVPVIGLDRLRDNKLASGRAKDLLPIEDVWLPATLRAPPMTMHDKFAAFRSEHRDRIPQSGDRRAIVCVGPGR